MYLDEVEFQLMRSLDENDWMEYLNYYLYKVVYAENVEERDENFKKMDMIRNIIKIQFCKKAVFDKKQLKFVIKGTLKLYILKFVKYLLN